MWERGRPGVQESLRGNRLEPKTENRNAPAAILTLRSAFRSFAAQPAMNTGYLERMVDPVASANSSASRRYRPAWWLPGPHSATLWGRFVRREPVPSVAVEQWTTPDGDFVELVRLVHTAPVPKDAPRVLFLHGLEGGSHSHYVRALFREAASRGWNADLLLFRTCGSEPNRLPRSYHSGDTGDVNVVIDRLVNENPHSGIGLVGVSLGANVICKLLGEWGDRSPSQIRGAVAISTPFDLARASRHIGRGFGAIYEKAFLRSLIPKALSKISRHSELSGLEAVRGARTLWEFDDNFTAPLHGFRDAAHYYSSSSSLPFLDAIRVPTLLLSARDDPFLPASVLDDVVARAEENPAVETEFPPRGGHVGFTSGMLPWRPWYYAEWRAAEFLAERF